MTNRVLVVSILSALWGIHDPAIVEFVRADPVAFVDGLPEKAILDEVQRVPESFSTLKIELDRNRRSGRTGESLLSFGDGMSALPVADLWSSL